jgi:hypothetical protein
MAKEKVPNAVLLSETEMPVLEVMLIRGIGLLGLQWWT